MIRAVANWIWMNKRAAVDAGFTHHGNYYGLPMYLADIADGCPTMCCKSALLDPIMALFMFFESTYHGDGLFRLRVDGPIKPS